MFTRACDYLKSWASGKQSSKHKKGGQTGNLEGENKEENLVDDTDPANPPPISETPNQEPLLDNPEGQTGNDSENSENIVNEEQNLESDINPTDPANTQPISETPNQEPLLDNPESQTGNDSETSENIVNEEQNLESDINPTDTANPPPISETPEQEPLLDNPEGQTGNDSETSENVVNENPNLESDINPTDPANTQPISETPEQESLLDNPEGQTGNDSETSENVVNENPNLEPEPEPEPFISESANEDNNNDVNSEKIEEGEGMDEHQGMSEETGIEPESDEQNNLLDTPENTSIPPIIPIFIETPEDFFDKSTSTFINSEIDEYTLYFPIYRINKSDPTHPFLQYLCQSNPNANSLTFPKTIYKNASSNYPPTESPDESPVDSRFTEEITKFVLDTTKIQPEDFSQIYQGVIPMSMDVNTNKILFVFINFSEIPDLSLIPSDQTWKICSDLAGYWIGLEKQPPIHPVDENIKILFDEHYEISRLKNESDQTVITSPLTVFLCKYDAGTQGWTNINSENGSNRAIDLIPRQDHPFGYYPFASLNIIGGENDGSNLAKYIFFLEPIRNTLYILPTVEGGEAPSQIDLYDGSVFKPVCLDDLDVFSDSTPAAEGDESKPESLEEKKYSAIYFVDQGNFIWCIKNTDLLLRL